MEARNQDERKNITNEPSLVTEGYETSEGEHLVGISFNPGGHEQVNMIKRTVADLIDYVRAKGKDPRCSQICITELESAAMWGVKSVTKELRK